ERDVAFVGRTRRRVRLSQSLEANRQTAAAYRAEKPTPYSVQEFFLSSARQRCTRTRAPARTTSPTRVVPSARERVHSKIDQSQTRSGGLSIRDLLAERRGRA